MRKRVFILLCALGMLFAANRVESAQSRFGTIAVHVQDKQGMALRDAEVSAKNETTKAMSHCTTDKNGDCRLDLTPGTYKVTVEATGFRFKPTEVDVKVEEVVALTLSPPLELAEWTQEGMVAYIDSAIVASQVRIRFDAAFNTNAPDRAEFFYAQCECNHGPGPGAIVTNLDFQQLYLRAEYAPTKRFSFFTEVPIRWIQPRTFAMTGDNATIPNQAGLSDVMAGFKLAAVVAPNQYLTFQLQAHFPSGDASSGLGTNHYSTEPALLYYRRLSNRAALEAEVGDSHPIGGSTNASKGFAGDVFFYGVGPSYVLYRGNSVRIAPVIELVGWRVVGGRETLCDHRLNSCTTPSMSADGTNIVNLKMGARTMFGAHSSFYLGYGRALTSAVWYTDIVRVEYRYSF